MKNIIFAFLIVTVYGCEKVAGEGGNSSIKGQVEVETRLVLTNPETVQSLLPASDEEVYIVYGDHVSPDDKVETDYEGYFEFRNLRKGDYTIYVYSKDTTGGGEILENKMPIVKEISIEDKKEIVDLDILTIYED